MAWTFLDAEANRITGDERVDIYELATRIVGPIEYAPHGVLTRSAQARLVAGGILVRPRLAPAVERFAIAHELAHHVLGHQHERDEHAEHAADYLAACIIAPAKALRFARAALGDDYDALATYFGTTQTCIMLRLGETHVFEGVAVVTPTVVHARAHRIVLPSADELRRVARSGALKPGIRKVQLTDAKRVALVVDDVPPSSRAIG